VGTHKFSVAPAVARAPDGAKSRRAKRTGGRCVTYHLLVTGLGVIGVLFAGFSLLRTLVTRTASVRGGRRITRWRNPRLYWTNLAALCMTVGIFAGLIYFSWPP